MTPLVQTETQPTTGASDTPSTAVKKRILLVEDEVHMVEMLKYRLVENQYEVASAADGYSALTQVRVFKPDLILLDLMIPKIDGYTICRLLKFNDELRQIPVMILSARSTDEDIRRGMAMGADAYMTKPYDPVVLLATIKEVLARDPNAPPPDTKQANPEETTGTDKLQ